MIEKNGLITLTLQDMEMYNNGLVSLRLQEAWSLAYDALRDIVESNNYNLVENNEQS